jgi:hypothetical protein
MATRCGQQQRRCKLRAASHRGVQRGLQIWPCPNTIPSFATSANFSKTAISFGLPQVAATKDRCRGRYRSCHKPRAVRSEALVIARGAKCTRAGAKKRRNEIYDGRHGRWNGVIWTIRSETELAALLQMVLTRYYKEFPDRWCHRTACQRLHSAQPARIHAAAPFEMARQAGYDLSRRWTQPTLPSRLMPTSFCASTANSIGSCCNTSRQKPLTIIETASSFARPRCRQ